jgi:hypothetical protein
MPQLICLLIFWPGVLQFDHTVSMLGIEYGQPNAWHSVLWGYMAAPFVYDAPSYGVYGLIQVSIQVAIVCYSLKAMMNMGIVHRRGQYVLAFIYGLSPCYLMYGLLWGTDTLFGLMMLLLTTQLMMIHHDDNIITKRSWIFIMIVNLFLLEEFRKNAILLIFIVGITLLIHYKRRHLIRTMAILLIPLMMSIGLSAIFTTIGVIPSPTQEALSVPAQQIARVSSTGGTVSPWAKHVFEKTRSWESWGKEYLPTFADPEKKNLHVDADFYKAWLDTGLKNPMVYFQAWRDLMFPYWQMGTDRLHTVRVDDVIQDFNQYRLFKDVCIPTGTICYNDNSINQRLTSRHSPALVLLQNSYGYIVYGHVPVVSEAYMLIFFNNALPLWVLIISFIMVRRKRSWFMIGLPLLYIMLSLLAFSPVALFRYAIQLYWSLPVFIAWAMHERRTSNGRRVNRHHHSLS